ncbi:hypothetical protein DCD74_02375 [Lysobacter oculi]|uniref:Uncharacterized protein n=1 Tax=Solilutibacter oculi TaxID=2698682 RepID=A0A344J3S9_9GAMM|nr:hypothetical protein [Lysobacter oculi]AXA83689.1 hypothetical protein DCD74_02375 [Lysobacter oculi]
MDVLPAHAVTPTDNRSPMRRISGASAAIHPARELSVLDQLEAERRLQLLAGAARVALCTGAEE